MLSDLLEHSLKETYLHRRDKVQKSAVLSQSGITAVFLFKVFTNSMSTVVGNERLVVKKTILIVDDDHTVCSETAKALSQSYKTYTAYNGREALEFYNKQQKIDLVLTDMIMPEMNGIELLKHLRKKNKDIAIILCSGCLTRDEASEALQQGAHSCLMKPVDLEHLELSIQSALQKPAD